jgi:hypothetical protein
MSSTKRNLKEFFLSSTTVNIFMASLAPTAVVFGFGSQDESGAPALGRAV